MISVIELALAAVLGVATMTSATPAEASGFEVSTPEFGTDKRLVFDAGLNGELFPSRVDAKLPALPVPVIVAPDACAEFAPGFAGTLFNTSLFLEATCRAAPKSAGTFGHVIRRGQSGLRWLGDEQG